ncbi:outer membrane protein [Gluconacetobacter sacchari DSM 12717]|uniref:Hedgehog/Intein (Hint) domain-containing protein n=2 Tax=Gluconacetobacter sacchari TaxID=92759 RepID=A0A7W4IG25_9PROT|nr:Hint domain-containing protein [Gluconacetobacter sacchari]MBB2162228.1 hypothetical protein [Gluconacetobacter sacchari]GBQ24880.1 outer membrane protein [Gluconacetobacter sacchari DSM 12717]
MAGNFTGTTSSGSVYSFVYNSGFLGLNPTYDMTITDPGGAVTTVNGIPAGNVLTANGGSLQIASLLLGGTYVIPPGVSGSVTTVASLLTLTDNTIYVGGNATIATAATVLSGTTFNVDGGTAILSNGIVANALSGVTVNLSNGGTFSNGGSLLNLLGGTVINFGTGGGTFVANGGGALINLSGTTINNYDPANSVIEFADTSTPVVSYSISHDFLGGGVTITALDANNNTVASTDVHLAPGVTLNDGTYSVASAAGSQNPLNITQANGNTYIGACFLAGTMIRTAAGDVAVEDVRIGDMVVAFDWHGSAEIMREVTWQGSQRVVVRPHLADDEAGWPVRVLEDAIADGVPCKDMLITAEHCLFFDGKFVPVRMLVNGRSIFYDKSITVYDYYHIETARHSVITADGMHTESYLDTGNRRVFRQDGKIVSFMPSRALSWDDAGAPLDVSRDFVEPLFRQIDARAEQAGIRSREPSPALTDEMDLHLDAGGGVTIWPARKAGDHVAFLIPAGVDSVRIVSRASRPSDVIGPFVDDRRSCGVAVGEITMFEGNRMAALAIHLAEKELEGWNVLEWEDTRWTSGRALLPLGERTPGSPALLTIQIKAGGPYLAEATLRPGIAVAA